MLENNNIKLAKHIETLNTTRPFLNADLIRSIDKAARAKGLYLTHYIVATDEWRANDGEIYSTALILKEE